MPDRLLRFRRWSLTTQLITSYFVIVGVVGLVTSAIGTWMTSRAFMQTAQSAGLHAVAVETRNQIIVVFFLLATVALILIIGTTYLIIRQITHPLVEIADAAHAIAEGEFDVTVAADQPGELGVLANAFNRMLASLRQMRSDLEEWGRTLENKVELRTQELVSMQARVALRPHAQRGREQLVAKVPARMAWPLQQAPQADQTQSPAGEQRAPP